MADPGPYPETDNTWDDTGAGPDRESAAGTPLWVKVSAIIALGVILLLIVMWFIVGGPIGSSGRMSSGAAPTSTMTASGAVGGHDQSKWARR